MRGAVRLLRLHCSCLLVLMALSGVLPSTTPTLLGQTGGPDSLLTELTSGRRALASATTAHDSATAWLRLQHAADGLMELLPQAVAIDECYDPAVWLQLKRGCPGYALVAAAHQVGMGITYCPSGEAYMRTGTGWIHYLRLWPDGPEADVAWWNVHVEPPCCDECTLESLDPYREFIKRFPTSALRVEAERRLRERQAALQPNGPIQRAALSV